MKAVGCNPSKVSQVQALDSNHLVAVLSLKGSSKAARTCGFGIVMPAELVLLSHFCTIKRGIGCSSQTKYNAVFSFVLVPSQY